MRMLFLFFLAFISSIEQGTALQQSQYDTDRAIQLRQDMGRPICKKVVISIGKKENLLENAETMQLTEQPIIKDSEKDQPAEIIAINGNDKLNSLFYYNPDVFENVLPLNLLLVMRHGETEKSKTINPPQSDNDITRDAEVRCNLIREILSSDGPTAETQQDSPKYDIKAYCSTTKRNVQTAIGIAGEKNLQRNISSILELSFGGFGDGKADKRKVLTDEKFKKAICDLKKFPDAENTVANEILQFSVGLTKMFQDKEQKMGIVIANSAMMGCIIYNILSHVISKYGSENIASCIPANLDFFCLSFEYSENDVVRFRIYDNRQVQQIFKDTNLGNYLSPSDKAKASINGTAEGALLQRIDLQRYQKDHEGNDISIRK